MNLIALMKGGPKAPDNRTVEQMLEDMYAKGGAVWLFKTLNGLAQWKCHFDANNMGVTLKVEGEGASPFEATFACYNKLYAMKILP